MLAQAANTELAIWEAKKAMGVLGIARSANAAEKALLLGAKLRRNKSGGDAAASKPPTLAERIKSQQAAEASTPQEKAKQQKKCREGRSKCDNRKKNWFFRFVLIGVAPPLTKCE